MKKSYKQEKTMQSAAPQRVQREQKEEGRSEYEEIRALEEALKRYEREISMSRERENQMRGLQRMKEQVKVNERETLAVVQIEENLKREIQELKERLDIGIEKMETGEMEAGELEQRQDERTADPTTVPITEDRVGDENSAVPQKAGPQPQTFSDSEAEDQASETQSPEAGRSSSGGRMLQSVLSRVRSAVQSLKFCFVAPEDEDEEEQSKEAPPSRPLIPLGAPTGVLTVHLRTCRGFSKTAPMKDTRAFLRVSIGRMVKCTVQRPYKDPMSFNEWKHFSIQISEDEVFGVQKSSLVVVELNILDPVTAAPKIIGRDTIKLKDILKKTSVGHHFNLQLRHKKVCTLDADLTFTYGSLGYGYSHQMKHPEKSINELVEKSLLPRCSPAADQRDLNYDETSPSTLLQVDKPSSTQLRMSTEVTELIRRRGRLALLRRGLEACKTAEGRLQFLEKLVLKKDSATDSPCRKDESSEVLSRKKTQKRREEKTDSGSTAERKKEGKAKCKTRK